jgi:hypothetical protein
MSSSLGGTSMGSSLGGSTMGSSLGETSMGSSLGWINEKMKRKKELELDSPAIANRSSIASYWIQATFKWSKRFTRV